MASATATAEEPRSTASANGGVNGDSMAHDTATVVDITSETQFADLKSTFPPSALLVIYFHAPWAAPCQQMSAVLKALASTYPAQSPPTVGFVSVDAESLPDIAESYDVTAVPYIVLQKDAKTVETVSGSDASKVRDAVEKHAGRNSKQSKFTLPPDQKVSKPQPVAALGKEAQQNGHPGKHGTTDETTPAASMSTSTESAASTSQEALEKRLSELVKAAPVMLFMKGTPSSPQCGFSRQTVGLLREKGIRYGFFNILADDEVRQGLKEFADWPTYPQLWVDGELVGGLDIVKEEFENNPEFLSEHSVKARPSGGTIE